MKQRKAWIIGLTALLLAVVLGASAAGGSQWGELWRKGTALLFDTGNVTLEGTMTFQLNGDLFKTVNAKYVQDGTDSLWDCELVTPRMETFDELEDGSAHAVEWDQKTGFIVIANYDPEYECNDLYVMERYKPGVYKQGSDDACETLVRRTPLMDQVVALAGLAVDQAGQLLDPSLLQVSEDGKTWKLSVSRENVSDLANLALTSVAQMVIQRVYRPVNYDSTFIYAGPTTTASIAAETRSYMLQNADVTITLDDEGRLAGIQGTVSVALNWVEPELDQPFARDETADVLTIGMDIAIGGYGTSQVADFNPADYGVERQY